MIVVEVVVDDEYEEELLLEDEEELEDDELLELDEDELLDEFVVDVVVVVVVVVHGVVFSVTVDETVAAVSNSQPMSQVNVGKLPARPPIAKPGFGPSSHPTQSPPRLSHEYMLLDNSPLRSPKPNNSAEVLYAGIVPVPAETSVMAELLDVVVTVGSASVQFGIFVHALVNSSTEYSVHPAYPGSPAVTGTSPHVFVPVPGASSPPFCLTFPSYVTTEVQGKTWYG